MKINELIFFKAIYPRHRDQDQDNEIKPDAENVLKIREYIQLHKKLPQKITYNKNHISNCPCGQQGYHILDGTHNWIGAKEEGWKEIPKEFLNEANIPIEREIWESARLNATHGMVLSRREIQAIFWIYFDPNKKNAYGSLQDFSKDFSIPIGTLKNWIAIVKGQREPDRCEHTDSNDINISDDKEKEKLKEEVKELRIENIELKKDAVQYVLHQLCTVAQNHIKSCDICGK